MPKAMKEIIIVLLAILLSMLILAVVLYDYIPNRIQSKETVTYSATDSVKELLQDPVAEDNSNIILTYEVTSTDLTNYEKAKEYVPGKQNPFAAYSNQQEETTENTNTSSSQNADSSSKEASTSSQSQNEVTTENEKQNTTSYFKNTGTK